MYKFSQTSKERLETCHPDLQRVAEEAIKRSMVDFGIAEGHRSIERQNLLYKAGKSRVDGIRVKGKHNYDPSLAFDVYAFVGGKASWDVTHLAYIGGVITSVASEMGIPIRWGGNWDMDGEIVTDQEFDDLPHFELLNK